MINPFQPKDFIELPLAIWVPRTGTQVFRGTPIDILLSLSASWGNPTKSTKMAIRHLTEGIEKKHRIRLKVPWEQPEIGLSRAFLRALLQSGLCQPVPDA